MGLDTKKPSACLLCNSKGRVYQVRNKSEIMSNDLLLISYEDEELVLLVLNILVKTRLITNISSNKAKTALTYIIYGSNEDFENDSIQKVSRQFRIGNHSTNVEARGNPQPG